MVCDDPGPTGLSVGQCPHCYARVKGEHSRLSRKELSRVRYRAGTKQEPPLQTWARDVGKLRSVNKSTVVPVGSKKSLRA